MLQLLLLHCIALRDDKKKTYTSKLDATLCLQSSQLSIQISTSSDMEWTVLQPVVCNGASSYLFVLWFWATQSFYTGCFPKLLLLLVRPAPALLATAHSEATFQCQGPRLEYDDHQWLSMTLKTRAESSVWRAQEPPAHPSCERRGELEEWDAVYKKQKQDLILELAYYLSRVNVFNPCNPVNLFPH